MKVNNKTLREKIKEKRILKDVREDTDYVKLKDILTLFNKELQKRLIKVEKLPKPEEEITMAKKKFAEEVNRELREILG